MVHFYTILEKLFIVVLANEQSTLNKLGGDFIKSFEQFRNTELTDCIRYHHAQEITSVKSNKEKNSLFYITYIADNISSGMDRRKDLEEGAEGFNWDKKVALGSVFNVLNEKEKGRQNYSYPFVARTRIKEEPTKFSNCYSKSVYNCLL